MPIFGKKRNAAIGESLEIYLGLEINSSRLADWGEFELKTTGKGSNRKISLFNIRWKYQNYYSAKKLVIDYGKPHYSKHLGVSVIRLDGVIKHVNTPLSELYINFPLNEGPLTLNYGKNLIAIVDRKNLKKWFKQKFINLVLIEIKSLKIDKKDGFNIENAILLENTSFKNFIKLIRSNKIKLSFKLMLILPKTPDEKFNNRGSGFRATQNILTELYKSKRYIL